MRKFALPAAFALLTSSAFGATITTTGFWTNPTGGQNVAGAGTNTLSWGEALPGTARSSYVFAGNGGVAIDLNDIESEFKLGTFTHNNFTIPTGSGISGAILNVDLAITNGNLFANMFTFDFTHTETPNNANPCAEGGVSPCPDLVGIPNVFSSQAININGMDFSLQILGFKNDIGDPSLTEFLTLENQVNSTMLFGRLTKTQTPIPEPSTYLLFGAGLLGLAALRRKNAK